MYFPRNWEFVSALSKFRYFGTPMLGPNQHCIQKVPGYFPGLKRPGRGVDHLPKPSAEVKERIKLYLYPPVRALVVCSMVNFTFTFRGRCWIIELRYDCIILCLILNLYRWHILVIKVTDCAVKDVRYKTYRLAYWQQGNRLKTYVKQDLETIIYNYAGV
jgi:hypothetical protein